MEVAGPLGTPLGLAQRKRASQKTGQGRFREPGNRALLIFEEDPGEATVCHALLLLPVASLSPVRLWGDLGKPGQAAP